MTNEKIKLPEAFCQRMQGLLGLEAEEFFSSYESGREYGLRYNPLKFTSQREFEQKLRKELGYRLSPVPWCAQGYYYREEEQPGKHPWHEAGAYYIQEPSAMSAVELLEVLPGDTVCDLCAAPGGKTTQIAGKMQGQGMLVSNEFYAGRAKILAQNVERLGIANTVVLNESTEHLAQVFPEFFDKILVDAPCSGEGMFRKEPQAVDEWSLDNVALCARRQQEILGHAAEMLKPGGVIVYSTCTFAPEENEQNIGYFLQEHPEFSLETAAAGEQYFSHGLPGLECSSEDATCNHANLQNIRTKELTKTYRLWPHKLRGEGHFLARLRKDGMDEEAQASMGKIAGKCREKRRSVKDKGAVRIEAAAAAYYKFQEETLRIDLPERLCGRYVLFAEELYMLPEAMKDLSGLKVVRAGLHLGACKKNRFEPSHALALYLHQKEAKRCVDLADYSEAWKYLHGETVSCDTAQKGWTLVCVDGLSLGWGKAHNGVVKNHYPKGLRICY